MSSPAGLPVAPALLKIVLLLANATCTYYGMKPPTPVARPEERAKAKSDSLGRLWTPKVMVTLAYPLRVSAPASTLSLDSHVIYSRRAPCVALLLSRRRRC